MANQSIYNAFERMWQHIVNALSDKANKSTVDTLQTEVDTKASSSDLVSHTSNTSNPHGVTAAQVGAAASNHNQAASTITAGTFAGQVVANGSGQTPATSLLRNSKLVSADTNPTVNGEICWTYE